MYASQKGQIYARGTHQRATMINNIFLYIGFNILYFFFVKEFVVNFLWQIIDFAVRIKVQNVIIKQNTYI